MIRRLLCLPLLLSAPAHGEDLQATADNVFKSAMACSMERAKEYALHTSEAAASIAHIACGECPFTWRLADEWRHRAVQQDLAFSVPDKASEIAATPPSYGGYRKTCERLIAEQVLHWRVDASKAR